VSGLVSLVPVVSWWPSDPKSVPINVHLGIGVEHDTKSSFLFSPVDIQVGNESVGVQEASLASMSSFQFLIGERAFDWGIYVRSERLIGEQRFGFVRHFFRFQVNRIGRKIGEFFDDYNESGRFG
jgi:hypothetical protein